MAKKIVTKKPRNRAAQDATLINLRALKRQIALLQLRQATWARAIVDLETTVKALETRVSALDTPPI